MSTEPLGAIKIDRLSLLPPELLSDIFDLAQDPAQPLREPLSKTLLPYFRQTLYRQIEISSTSSLSKLLETVKTLPSLAPLFRDLRIRYVKDLGQVEFEFIARRFTSLRSLDYGAAQFSNVSFVAPLQSLSYAPAVFDVNEINALSRLPLTQLELKLSFSEIEIPYKFQPSTTMQTLEEFILTESYAMEDEDEWVTNVSRFVRSCPKLRSLKLDYNDYPTYEKFLQALVGGVPLLIKLELNTPYLDDVTICSFTHLYPRFPQLTFLSLDAGTTAPDLASHLHQLSYLTTVRLGPGTHYGFESAENLFSLVRASTKPPALKLLIFECFGPTIGYRCKIGDELFQREICDPFYKEEWNPPSFSGYIRQDECRQLLELAKETDVRVEGDIHAAINFENSRNREVVNRHVLYAFQNQTLELLKPLNETRYGAIYLGSDFDVDQLDPENLKLVKIDLPEEDWFRFTLE
ncbi:hypothetical protein JCM5350_003925 [Sporobolomyces pararoseus]